MPSKIGICTYIITVNRGELRLNHFAYNLDTDTWSLPPEKTIQATYELSQGQQYEITFEIGKSFNKADIVKIENRDIIKSVEFSYVVKYD